MPIAASGRVRSCNKILKFPASGLCAKQSQPSAFCGVDELSRDFQRTEIIEVSMTAARKLDELLRFVRERKQAFAESDRYRGIVGTVHDQERRGHARDALVG